MFQNLKDNIFFYLIPLGGFLVYLLALGMLSYSQDVPWTAVQLYDPLQPPQGLFQLICHLGMGIGGTFIVFLFPALPLVRSFNSEPWHHSSFLVPVYITQLSWFILASTLFKVITGHALSRGALLIMYVLLFGMGTILLSFRRACQSNTETPRTSEKERKWLLLFIAVLVLILLIVFSDKVFVENFSGDGTEAYEFGASLIDHPLPQWDLENGTFGFYPQFLLPFYPNAQMILLLGQSECSVRIPFFMHFVFIIIIMYDIVMLGLSKARKTVIVLLSVIAVYFVEINYFYSTYSFTADLAELINTDTMFTFEFCALLYLILIRNRIFVPVMAFFLAISQVSGFGAALLAFLVSLVFLKHRKQLLIQFLVFLVVAGGFLWITSTAVQSEVQKFSLTQVIYKHFSAVSLEVVLTNLSLLLRVVGFLPLLLPLIVVPLLWWRRSEGDSLRHGLATGLICYGYCIPLLLSPKMHIHYVVPLIFLLTVPLVKLVDLLSEKIMRMVFWAHILTIIVFLILAFPSAWYEIDTRAREMGIQCELDFKNTHAEFTCSQLIHVPRNRGRLLFPSSPYQALELERYFISRHTLFYYAGKEKPQKTISFLFTDQARPENSDWKLIAHNEAGYFYTRSRRMLRNWSIQRNPVLEPGILFRDLQFGHVSKAVLE